jgi:hypothetical protein
LSKNGAKSLQKFVKNLQKETEIAKTRAFWQVFLWLPA